MAKNNDFKYPSEPVGFYEEHGQKYLVFELKTKGSTLADVKGDNTEWMRRYDETMPRVLSEVRQLFPPKEKMYRFAAPIDLLERSAVFVWTIGSGRISSQTTAFGEYKFYFSIAEGEEPELFPCHYWRQGPFERDDPFRWSVILEMDIENLCVLSDRDQENTLYGKHQGGYQQLFTTGIVNP